MANWFRAFRRNWDAALAMVLLYTVIAIYLGPG